MGDIKWIPLEGMELSAVNLAAAEKLRKFGFAVICGEFGSEKLTKAGLCIYDVLQQKENPNILLITSSRELYGWYRILTTGIGADFKIITGAPGALAFFSESCPNLFLMSSEALSGRNVLKTKADESFVWDLVIIDEEQNTSVPDYDYYKKNIGWKSEKLLITAPFPAKTDEDSSRLAELVSGILRDESLAEQTKYLAFGMVVSEFDEDCAAMRYFDKRVYTGELKRNISFCDYSFDADAVSSLRRKVDLLTGNPVYRYGGNIFEEYDCEAYKRVYQKSVYTRSDVEDLRAFDKKLDSFLKLMDDILKDENRRAIVYCCDKNTVDFLKKTLSCVYHNDGIIRAAKGELFRAEDIKRKFRVDDGTVYPRIIIGMDGMGAVGEGLDRIDCIINYELPSSAALLERRMTRHGAAREAERQFIIFRDGNGMFDSRMLDKVLYGGIESGFCGELPTRNILLDIPGKGKSLSSVISDLKYIHSFATEVDSCFDLIKRVKCEYIHLGAKDISNSKQLAEFAQGLLRKLYGLFGLTEDSAESEISEAIEALSGLCVIRGGRLEKLPGDTLADMARGFDGDGYKSQPFAKDALNGLAEAKAEIDTMHDGKGYHLTVKNQVNELPDCVKYSVLFGIWRYRVRERDSQRSFKDFVKIFNDGM